MGLEVEETQLEYGDLSFVGKGDGGRPVSIGIEFKQLGECVASLRSERLQGHQLPGMREAYDFSWLLIEGELLYDKRGRLLRRAGKREFTPMPGSMGISEYLKRVLVLHLRGGLNPWHTQSRLDTLKFIECLYRTWTDCDLDKHQSHLAIYQAAPLMPISDTRAAFKAWPSIGIRGSKAVEDTFKSVRRAARATVSEWAAVQITDDKGKTRRIGDKTAVQIDAFLDGK
jgi:ERCC4-type nuclease